MSRLTLVAVVTPVLVVVALVFAGDQVSGNVPPDERASIVLTAGVFRVTAILLTVAWLTAIATLLARALRGRGHASGRERPRA